MNPPEQKTVSIQELLDRVELDLELVAGAQGLDRTIEYPRVQKSGLALAGFLESVRPHRLQIFGKTELQYLFALNEEMSAAAIEAFFRTDVAAVIVTAGQSVPETVISSAERYSIPVIRSSLDSSRIIGGVQEFLDEQLSPEETVHGVMLEVFGIGVLLLGASGIGKSECALDLILRGHRLIADDAVRLVLRRNAVIANSVELTKHHMEIRGLGVINVMDLYGAASVRDRIRVELVVEMTEGLPLGRIDRLGLDEYKTVVLGAEIAKVTIPVRPGRNVSTIVEVAARNHLLKLQGHHSAQVFRERVEQRLAHDRKENGR